VRELIAIETPVHCPTDLDNIIVRESSLHRYFGQRVPVSIIQIGPVLSDKRPSAMADINRKQICASVIVVCGTRSWFWWDHICLG
jgi:hypothetical protein